MLSNEWLVVVFARDSISLIIVRVTLGLIAEAGRPIFRVDFGDERK